MHGWELREARVKHGLTLRQVARAAGTSVSNVSAYERGAKRPTATTANRLLAVVAAGSDSPVHKSNLFTVPRTAALIRDAVRQGDWSTADLVRLVREMVSNSKFAVKNEADRAAFFAEPSSTGDQRWNAMLAGVVEVLAARHGFERPDWCRGHVLPTFWFVGSVEDLHAYAYAHTPFPLHMRGVFIDPADLEYV